MSGKPAYRVDAERRDQWWTLTSPDAPGAVSQVRKLSQAEEHAREAIAFVLGVSADTFDVHVVPKLDAELAAEVAAARELTAEAAISAKRAADRQRQVVEQLDQLRLIAIFHLATKQLDSAGG